MSKTHFAIYGTKVMKRGYCRKCKGYAIILDGKFLCCDSEVKEGKVCTQKMMCDANDTRKTPSRVEGENIIKVQGNRCLYCGLKFGTLMYRKKTNKIFVLRLNWDHLVPYAYSRDNKANFVAACHVCNNIKSNKVFNTVEDVFHYVRYHRKKKGYQSLGEEIDSKLFNLGGI